MVGKMTYVVGDATEPLYTFSCIAHVTNDSGGWGQGFVLALERRWPGLGRLWKAHRQKLGDVAIDTFLGQDIAHLCAQRGYATAERPVALDYEALETCLDKLAWRCDYRGFGGVHMPRIGCGLAGGDWHRVEALIQKCLVDKGVDVWVYDLEKP